MTVLKRQSETKEQKPEHPPSFESLYHQYHIRIYRYLCTHLKNDDDAADLTQQIFFQVWMRLPTYQPAKGSFSTWLFRGCYELYRVKGAISKLNVVSISS